MMRKVAIRGTILLIILLMSAFIGPELVVANQDVNNQKSSNIALIEGITSRLLAKVGYQSPKLIHSDITLESRGISSANVYSIEDKGKAVTIQVESTLLIRNGTNTGYEFNAHVLSEDREENSLREVLSRTKTGNTTISDFTQEIIGPMHISSKLTEVKTVGSLVDKKTTGVYQFSNESVTHSVTFASDTKMTPDESIVLQGTISMDQNKTYPQGHYAIEFASITQKTWADATGLVANSTAIKSNITLPDGKVIDPGLVQFADETSGWDVLYGWWIWWEPGYEWIIEAEMIALGVELTILAPEIGWVVDLMDTMLLVQQLYQSDMSGITIAYFEMVCFLGIVPYYAEAGYYTDQVLYPGNPYPTPLNDWYYCPLIPLPTLPWHNCEWPPNRGSVADPPVTLLCYDESAERYIGDMSIIIDDEWVQPSGTIIPLPPGEYTIEAPDFDNAFQHFDINGTSQVYDNPATITVPEEQITITAHYSHFYYWVTNIASATENLVSYPENLMGWRNDGEYAWLQSYDNYYSQITGTMIASAKGDIYVYGFGYGTGERRLTAYVSTDSSNNWDYIGSTIVDENNPYWIYLGTSSSEFTYIRLTTESSYQDWFYIALDSVYVD